jgi:Tfp pilus assembly protein PilX
MRDQSVVVGRQRGAVLVIALIMLLLTTLIALSVFDMGSSNLALVSNLENKRQVEMAAEATLEAAVDELPLLIESLSLASPKAVFFCEGRKNHQCFDINGDGASDIEVDLANPAPNCIGMTPITNDDLEATDINDQGCFIGTQQVGLAGGSGSAGQSLCSWSVWDLRALATDLSSGAQARVRQGIRVRVSNNDIATACP